MLTQVEVVKDRQRLCAIRPAWDSLWRQSGASVFQSHRWITAWSNECSDALRLACAWRGDELVAVLPLCIRSWHGLRVLEWAAQSFSDYCDAMVPDGWQPIELLWDAVTRIGGFDLVRLKHIRPDAAVQPLLQGVGIEERVETCLQVACQWPSGEAWFRNLNKKTRNNYTRGKRILGESGPIVFRQLADDEPREPVIQRLLALKRHWVENRDAPLVRSDTTLLSLTEALHQMGSLRIFVIECAGTIIAGSINAIHRDRMLALFATYDAAYERASPGILLMTDYTIWGFDHGITEIDYLLGAEPYKFRYANREVKLHIFIAGKTLRGRLALAAYQRLRRYSQPTIPSVTIGSAYLTEKGTPRKPPKKAKASAAA